MVPSSPESHQEPTPVSPLPALTDEGSSSSSAVQPSGRSVDHRSPHPSVLLPPSSPPWPSQRPPLWSLIPPSKPFCSFDHKHQPELGHLVILSCLSSTGLPNPTYQWQRVEGDKLKPLSDLYYPESGTLIIGNLTKFEEGYYQCTSSNSLGNSSCQIDLTTKHSESGIIIAALIASILAAALICVIVWVITSKEKKKKRKEKAAASEMQKMNQKEPPNAVYAAVPSQESVPIAGAPPNETNEYATSGEVAAATTPENEMQEMEHQTAA
ncbi:V-set and immunoglobulin domain-containing protein 1 [Varanus komodoensis]|nr:V-set and immunoglobulin domain-containing protein 1 [Varanus komodoensis]